MLAICLFAAFMLHSAPALERGTRNAELETRRLQNGLTVIVSPEAGSGRVAAVLMVRAGDADDPPDAPGAAQLLAGFLIQEPANSSARKTGVAAFDGDLWSEAEADVTTFSAVTTPEQLPAALKLLEFVARPPSWTNTATMRAVQREGAAERREAPADWEEGWAAWQSKAGLDPARPPSETQPVDVPTLRDLHDALYTPRRMTLAIVGDVSAAEAFSQAASAFNGLGDDDGPRIRPRRRHLSWDAPPSPTYTFAGFPAPAATDDDAPAVEVIATALGTGKTSAIFQNLRERDGTGYESGVVYPRRLERSAVALFARAPGHAADVRASLLALWKSGASLQPDAVAAARARAAFAYLGQHQTARDRAYWLAFWDASGVGAGGDAAYLAKLRAVTANDAKRVAARWLSAAPAATP